MHTDVFHKLVVEIEIVKNCQAHSEHFSCLKQVTDVRARIPSASGTVTVGVNGQRVGAVFLVVEVDDT